MIGILNKLLAKRGIKSFNELDKEEKVQFEEWKRILSKDELTIEDVKEFCKTQIDIINNKWKDLEIPQEKKAEWITPYTIYKTLQQIIESPKKGREQLEQYLNELISK